MAEDLSKYASVDCSCTFVPFLHLAGKVLSDSNTGSSTISNQLLAGSIIVRHIKSICVPSLPLRVYGPIRSTHNASHGVVIATLVGSFPYFSFLRLLVYQEWHFLTYDRTVVRIPFQYIAAFNVSSRRVCPGCWR